MYVVSGKGQNMKFFILTGFLLIMLYPERSVFCQNTPVSGLTPGIFQSDDPIPVTIRTDMSLILGHQEDEEKYQPAEIIYNEGGTSHTLEMKIRVRGHFRKDTANCDFPPLRINLKKKDIGNTLFGPQDKYRIVTHCRTTDNHFVQFVIREYLVYRMYKIINPLSLNVRLASITYEDTGGQLKPFTRYAFILEDENEFAYRFNLSRITDKVTYDQIDNENVLLLSLFQFMIGNTDWIVQFSKNLVFLKKEESVYVVPYDFDYCGIVNTDYKNKYGFTSLTEPERIFKGKCYTENQLRPAIRHFRKSKRKIIRLLLNTNQLDHESLVYMYNYISQFYTIIGSRSERKKYLFVNCSK